MRTATKKIILTYIDQGGPMLLKDLIEEPMLSKLHPKTVAIGLKWLHEQKQVYIVRWEWEHPGIRNYPRPVFGVTGDKAREDAHAPTTRPLKTKHLYLIPKERPCPTKKQRIALEHNWQLKMLKGLQRNFSNLCFAHNCDKYDANFSVMCDRMEQLIIDKRTELIAKVKT